MGKGWRLREGEEAKGEWKRDLGRVKGDKERLGQTGVKGHAMAATCSPTNSGPISLSLSTASLSEDIHEYYWQIMSL